ncbi:MAG: hypothetical protein RLP09_00610 [Sandaracinaceae bacterium]
MLHRLSPFTGLTLLCLLALAGCDGGMTTPDDAGPGDAGPIEDAGEEPDAGPSTACGAAMQIEADTSRTIGVRVDTSKITTAPETVGTPITIDPFGVPIPRGNPMATTMTPQQILEIAVPGEGLMRLTVDVVNAETNPLFNTFILFRTEGCDAPDGSIMPPRCFDAESRLEVRSRGSITVEGGSTVWAIVGGVAEPPMMSRLMDRGMMRIDISVEPNQAPTIATGELYLAEDEAHIFATGTDPDGNVTGIAMNFYVGGELLDITDDGSPASVDRDVAIFRFDPAIEDPDYNGFALVRETAVNLAPFIRANGVDRVAFRAYDQGYLLSDPIDVVPAEATLVGWNAECGGEMVCRREMMCTDGRCAPTPDANNVCGLATEFPYFEPMGNMTVTQTLTGSTGSGRGVLRPTLECVPLEDSIGIEKVYLMTIPDGLWDLTVTTDAAGTGETDTILYMRANCFDSGSELACNNDISDGNVRSTIEVTEIGAGTFALVVEQLGVMDEGEAPHEIVATLRPVLGTGEACDPAGVENRCQTGSCTAGVCTP